MTDTQAKDGPLGLTAREALSTARRSAPADGVLLRYVEDIVLDAARHGRFTVHVELSGCDLFGSRVSDAQIPILCERLRTQGFVVIDNFEVDGTVCVDWHESVIPADEVGQYLVAIVVGGRYILADRRVFTRYGDARDYVDELPAVQSPVTITVTVPIVSCLEPGE